MRPTLFISLTLLLTGCGKNPTYKSSPIDLSEKWYYKDPQKDSVPGIGLYRLEHQNAKHAKTKEIIVAILDTGVDLNHSSLKNQFWVNEDEIPDNGIDDDHNGYIDDVHGWNFLGGSDEDTRTFNHFSSIRFLKLYRDRFQKLIHTTKLEEEERLFLKEYQRAQKDSIAEWKYLELRTNYKKWYDSTKIKSDSLLRIYNLYPPYKLPTIDSLFNVVYRQNKNEVEGRLVYFTLDVLKNNRLPGYLKNKEIINKSLRFCLNESHTERSAITTVNTTPYGNNKVNTNYRFTSHGTEIAGTIAAIKEDANGTRGVFNKAKIMVLQITPELGSEHEEDLINAIYYSVENGAQVINYSSSLNFLCYPDRVYKALSYAEKKNVLFVTSAGNRGINLENYTTHPRNNYKGRQLSNFIMVGASDSTIGRTLKPVWSNYGENTIDLFAPGANIKTTWPEDQYKRNSGSSISAAMVSGAAAYLLSDFPNLSASDVKNCLINSATTYDIPVQVTKSDTLAVKSFLSLSNSGGILNMYEALLEAKKISKESESRRNN
ncbi:S8 family serine peptidase [Flavobacteriaceae bacterium M23B6Z8]